MELPLRACGKLDGLIAPGDRLWHLARMLEW